LFWAVLVVTGVLVLASGLDVAREWFPRSRPAPAVVLAPVNPAAPPSKPVDDAGHFRNLVASTAPGSNGRLTVVRGGREQTIEVPVAPLPSRATIPALASVSALRAEPRTP
jgi:hypothetical protein